MGRIYLEGCQDLGEDVRLDDHLRQVHAVLGDLGEAGADLEGERKAVGVLPFMCGSGIEKKVTLKWERKIVAGADLEGETRVVGVLLFRCGFGKRRKI
jgi:hypothetical protein